MKQAVEILRALILASAMMVTTGCTEYWWSRGQPQSPKAVLQKAEDTFDEAVKTSGPKRPEIVDTAVDLRRLVTRASAAAEALAQEQNNAPAAQAQHDKLLSILNETNHRYADLEGKLSLGSRAAYGELGGELRAILHQTAAGAEVKAPALQLLASRVVFFLAQELTVPPPSIS